jgi:hypothetical protein
MEKNHRPRYYGIYDSSGQKLKIRIKEAIEHEKKRKQSDAIEEALLCFKRGNASNEDEKRNSSSSSMNQEVNSQIICLKRIKCK